MNVVIRTDASVQIGSGHVMRCLTLADALRKRGVEVIFICREHVGNLCGLVEEKGYRVNRLSPQKEQCSGLGWNLHASWLRVSLEQDARETIEAFPVHEKSCDWLIVDHYALDRKWETLLRPLVKKIMVIDDLADRDHDCDLLLDQNLYSEMETRYTELVPDSCHQLLGPRYALLREEFVRVRNKLKPIDGTAKRVLIFMGGNDPNNETEKVLKAIIRSGLIDLEIDVVLGLGDPHNESIKKLCAQKLPKANFHCQINNMAELMTKADFAVCSGGTITWERCCLGLPAIVMAMAENQVALSSFSAQLGLCLYLGKADSVSIEKIGSALRIFCNAPELLQSFSTKSKRVVDGQGQRRVLGFLAPIEVSLRQATIDDCDLIHQWRNAEETRRYIFDSQPIPIEIHRQWFQQSLCDPCRLIFVADVCGKPVGVLRYDFIKDEAVISIYLVPGEHVAGTGTAIIKTGSDWLRQNCLNINAVRAEVMPQNIASQKAFMAAGYEAYNFVFKDDLTICPRGSQLEEE